MSESKCIALGKPKDFGGDIREMEQLAARAPDGIPGVIDTCDLTAVYGAIYEMPPEAMVNFFRGEKNAPLSRDLLQNRLSFYREYPKTDAIAAKRNTADMTGSDGIIRILDWYYAKISTLHSSYDIPLLPEETCLFSDSGSLLINAGMMRQAADLFMWLCASVNVPDEMFSGAIGELIIDHLKNGGIDIGRGELAQDSLLAQCRELAPPRRRVEINSMVKDVSAKLLKKLPKQVKVGDTLGVPAIKDAIKDKKGAIIFAWAPWCGVCKKALPALEDASRRLQTAGAALIGITSRAEDATLVLRAIDRFKIEWPNISLEAETFDRITLDDDNMHTSVPTILVLDANGKIIDVIKGGDRDAVERAIKAIGNLAK